MGAHPGMQGRSRPVTSHASIGTRSMTASDVAHMLEAMHQQYPVMQQYDDDAHTYSAALGVVPGSSSMHLMGRQQQQQQQQQQLGTAWSAGPLPGGVGAGGFGVPRGPAGAPGRSRPRRQQSFDAAAYRASQPSQSSQIWGPAAAAAAAECGYPQQLNMSSEIEQLQLQQQHLSSVYAAAAQQWPDAASMQQHQGLAQDQGSGSGVMPAAVQGAGTLGSGSSSNRGSGHSGSYSYGQQQQQQRDMLAAAASGALGPAAAAAAVLHGQRSSASQQGPLSPAASADPQSLPAGGGRAASAGMPSMLPKYPSNISNYSAVSASSARSLGPGQDGHGPASGGSQQQQGGEDGASGTPAAAAAGAMASGRGSRLGALSPETVGSARQEQQQQQQPLNLVAARARSALGITQQGSGHSLGDMSPNMISPRQQQQQQHGSEGATPASSAAASARSGRTARSNVSFNNRQQQQQQQQHYSGGHVEAAEHMMLHEHQLHQQQQQHLEADTSPRYATGSYSRGTPAASLQHRQQMLNHARSAGAALQQQQLYADDDVQGYGMLSPGAHQGYLEAEDGGPWQADLHTQHGVAAAMAAAASSGLHGPAAPAQYPYMSALHAGSGPTSTGSTQGRISTYTRLAAALSSLGYHPHLAGPGGSSSNQQMLMASMYPQHAGADAGGWDMDMGAAVGDEDDSIAAATRVVMLQQQVASVQAARAELQSQQQEIEELLAFKQLPEAEQERILEMLATQFQQVQQQQQQQMHRQQMLQRPVSPHVGPLNVLGTGMGSSSSSNVQGRLPRGPQGPSSYMGPGGGQQPGMVSPEAPAGAGQAGLMASGNFLQRATSTASTASIGSPKSTHSARTRASVAAALAGAAAAAAAVGSGRPSTPEHAAAAAAAAEAALLESQAEAAAALLAQQQQQQQGLVHVNGSSAASPSSSHPPGSPTGSRSTPSRSALSRGASGSYDANTQPAAGSAGSGGAGPGRLGSATSSKGALMGQRSISPDRLRRPASAAAVLSQQQQQKPLHRLHRDNSYDQQIGEAAEAAGMAAAQRAGSVGPPQQQQQQQQRSPTNGPMRGPPVPGMPPMPATAWQQREQQQQQQLPQQYVQMMLAQQQQQQQQQLQLPQQALPRRPARMSSPSPYVNVAAPTSPMGYQSGYMPSSATAVAAAYASQQQQQLLQPQGSGHQSGQLALSGSRVGLQGMGGPVSGGRAPAGQPTRSAAVAAAAAAVLRGATSPVGMAGAGGRVPSYSAGMAARPLPMQQQQQSPALPAMGYAHGHPQLAVAGLGSGTAGGPVPLTQQQISNLVLRQQQLRQQQMSALQAHYGALQQQQQQQQQQHEADLVMMQYDGQSGSQEAEDYGLWATPPDYGGSGYADEGGSSRGASGSRTLLAPSGGQYWQGRRSNSWSNNMADAVLGADEAASPHSQTLPRSRSSEDVPMVMHPGGPEQHQQQ